MLADVHPRIYDYMQSARLSLTSRSHSKGCATHIFLPVGFTGLIQGETFGAFYLSPAVEKQCRIFTRDLNCPDKDRRFIGEYKDDQKHSIITLNMERDLFQNVWIQFFGEHITQDVTSTWQYLMVKNE